MEEFIKKDYSEEENHDFGDAANNTVIEVDEESVINDDEPVSNFTLAEEPVELPEGVGDVKKSPTKMKSYIAGAFVIGAAIALILGLVMWKKMSSSDKVEVKNNSNVSTINKTNELAPDDTRNTIEKVKTQAAPDANTNSNSNVNTQVQQNQPSLVNGNVGQQNPGTVPLVGQPIYDVRNQPVPNDNSGRTNNGGSSSTVSLNTGRSKSENETSKVQPKDSPTPALAKVARVEQPSTNSDSSRNPSYSGGRNEQISLSFGGGNKTKIESSNSFSYTLGKPGFGVVLPVRLMGALHTLQSGGLVRMELSRTMEGKNYRLGRGTVFVGRVAGGVDKRVFVTLIGYLDQTTNQFIELSGDVLGTDGAIGFEGTKKQLQSRWRKVFADALNKATQLGTAYLLGRKGGNSSISPSSTSVSPESIYQNLTKEQAFFVTVSTGANAYIMVNNLPSTQENPTLQKTPANNINPSQPVAPNPGGQIAQEEIIKILTNGTPEEIRAAIPRMSPEWQQLAMQALASSGK